MNCSKQHSVAIQTIASRSHEKQQAARALLAACQLMIDGDWITACAAARAAIAQAEAAGIKVMT